MSKLFKPVLQGDKTEAGKWIGFAKKYAEVVRRGLGSWFLNPASGVRIQWLRKGQTVLAFITAAEDDQPTEIRFYPLAGLGMSVGTTNNFDGSFVTNVFAFHFNDGLDRVRIASFDPDLGFSTLQTIDAPSATVDNYADLLHITPDGQHLFILYEDEDSPGDPFIIEVYTWDSGTQTFSKTSEFTTDAAQGGTEQRRQPFVSENGAFIVHAEASDPSSTVDLRVYKTPVVNGVVGATSLEVSVPASSFEGNNPGLMSVSNNGEHILFGISGGQHLDAIVFVSNGVIELIISEENENVPFGDLDFIFALKLDGIGEYAILHYRGFFSGTQQRVAYIRDLNTNEWSLFSSLTPPDTGDRSFEEAFNISPNLMSAIFADRETSGDTISIRYFDFQNRSDSVSSDLLGFNDQIPATKIVGDISREQFIVFSDSIISGSNLFTNDLVNPDFDGSNIIEGPSVAVGFGMTREKLDELDT